MLIQTQGHELFYYTERHYVVISDYVICNDLSRRQVPLLLYVRALKFAAAFFP